MSYILSIVELSSTVAFLQVNQDSCDTPDPEAFAALSGANKHVQGLAKVVGLCSWNLEVASKQWCWNSEVAKTK